MSVLTRYKRDGKDGFEDLVIELEQASDKIYDLRMKSIEAEDLSYAECIKASMFRFKECVNLEEMVITEIISLCKDKRILAIAIYKEDPELVAKFAKSLSPLEKRDFDEITSELKGITVGSRDNMQKKIIKSAREHQRSGTHFTLKAFKHWYQGIEKRSA